MSASRNKISAICNSITFIIGLGVMTGWVLHIPAIVQINENWVPMQFNTALSFTLASCAAFAQMRNLHILQRYFAALLLVLCGVTLIQNPMGVNFGVDELFITHSITTLSVHPGRMAPNTAICFILAAIAFLDPIKSFRALRFTVLASFILAFALAALLGYFGQIDTALIWGNVTKMAAHTATGFAFFAFGVLFYHIPQFEISEHRNIPLTAIPITIVVSTLTVVISAAVYNHEENALRLQLDRLSMQFKEGLASDFNNAEKALRRVANRWVGDGLTKQNRWEADARIYLDDFSIYNAIMWVDDKQAIRWVQPEQHASKLRNAVETYLSEKHEAQKKIVRINANNDDEHSLLMLMEHLNFNKEHNGHVLAFVDPKALLKKRYAIQNLHGVRLSVYENNKKILQFQDNENTYLPSLKRDARFPFDQLDWTISISPSQEFVESFRSSLPFLTFINGTLILVLLGFSYFLLGRSRTQSYLLKREINQRERLSRNMEQVLEAAPVGMIMVDDLGEIVTANHEISQLFGFEYHELVGQPIEILIPEKHRAHHQSLRAGYVSAPQKRFMQEGLETSGLHKDGHLFPVEIGLNPINTNKGKRVVASVLDISERVENQKKIERYMKELERSNEELDDFAYIASHDLKSPLRGISQLSQWIAEDLGDKLNDTVSKHLSMMQVRIKRMENLLEDLLAYSRVAKTNETIKEINSRELIASCFDLVTKEGEALLVLPDKEYPVLKTVLTPLEQILRNLFNNAVKHGQGRKISISVDVEKTLKGYLFTVSDDGPGIAPELHETVFAMFQTLRPRDEVEGSGMGLALVKKILNRYGEDIELESDGEHGTLFRFTWPSDDKIESILKDNLSFPAKGGNGNAE